MQEGAPLRAHVAGLGAALNSTRKSTVLLAGAVFVVAVAGCSSDETGRAASASPAASGSAVSSSVSPAASSAVVAPASTAASAIPSSGVGAGLKACEVTGAGGASDGGLSAAAWSGVQDAATQFGVEANVLETSPDNDYAASLTSFVDQGCSVIITVGSSADSAATDATLAAADANPDIPFTIVDVPVVEGSVTNNNVLGQEFNTPEVAFLAGYLAAGMTNTGAVGTFGGIASPAVTRTMDAFYYGVQRYNVDNGAAVKVLGWNPDTPKKGLFVGEVDKAAVGSSLATDLVEQGADIVMPVAGPAALGAASVATKLGPSRLRIIGTDADQYLSDEANKGVYLTSLMKNANVTTFKAIASVVQGVFDGGTTTGTLANRGVSLAPFHDFDADVPQALKDQIATLTAGIVDGSVSVSGP